MQKIGTAILAIAVVCIGFTTEVRSEDYLIEEESTQSLELRGANSITVRCYCYSEILLRRSLRDPPMLKVTATLESVGYHGPSERPKGIEKSLMVFEVLSKGDEVVVESKERTHMHTAFLIKKLELVLPPGVELHTESIPFQELEGR